MVERSPSPRPSPPGEGGRKQRVLDVRPPILQPPSSDSRSEDRREPKPARIHQKPPNGSPSPWTQGNIQHRTSNAEHRMAARILAHFGVRCSMLDVRCWMFLWVHGEGVGAFHDGW